MKNYGEIYVSSNNLVVHNGFCYSLYHLKLKMVTYFSKAFTLETRLSTSPITFKSDAPALIWPKSLSQGWPFNDRIMIIRVMDSTLC